jgi:hypothetical protein
MVTRPPAPISSALTGSPQDQMRQIADAISRKADATLEPTYTAILLLAPGGATYRVGINDAGGLVVTAVPR